MLQTKPKRDYNYGYSSGKRKKEKKDINTKFLLKYILCLLCIGLFVVAYIGQFVHMAHLNYRLNEAKEVYQHVKDENNKLNIKLAKNRSLEKIEEIARNELNMVEPAEVEIIVLNNEPSREEKESKSVRKDKMFFAWLFEDVVNQLGKVEAHELD